MCVGEEEELHLTDSSEMTDSDSDSAAASFVISVRKTTHKTHEVMEQGGEAPQNSRFRFCRYCGKGFGSNKALYGHIRIHRQSCARSKPEISHIEIQRQPSPEEDGGFGCFVCNERFSSVQLLCHHTRLFHRQSELPLLVSNWRKIVKGVVSNSKTTVKGGIESTVSTRNDNNWSQTGERGLKKTASDDDVMHDAVPLRVYHGPAHPHVEIRNKRKIKDTSTEGIESEIPCMAIDRFGNKPKSRSRMKKAKVMNSEHPCEICGKTFTTGQAIGGHKTSHRVKNPPKVELLYKR